MRQCLFVPSLCTIYSLLRDILEFNWFREAVSHSIVNYINIWYTADLFSEDNERYMGELSVWEMWATDVDFAVTFSGYQLLFAVFSLLFTTFYCPTLLNVSMTATGDVSWRDLMSTRTFKSLKISNQGHNW